MFNRRNRDQRLMRSNGALVPSVLLLLLMGCGSESPTPDDLYRYVQAQNVDSVRWALSLGVDPTSRTAADQSPLVEALVGVTGSVSDPSFRNTMWPADSPNLLILRDVMGAVRGSTHSDFEMTGQLAVVLEEGGVSPEGNMRFLQTTYLDGSSGRFELLMSLWETTYVDTEGPDGSILLLRPGADYRVSGAEAGGVVEVSRLQLVDSQESNGVMQVQVSNYLPSTFEYMREHTWLGTPGRDE